MDRVEGGTLGPRAEPLGQRMGPAARFEGDHPTSFLAEGTSVKLGRRPTPSEGMVGHYSV
jgi:hypothetical protein